MGLSSSGTSTAEFEPPGLNSLPLHARPTHERLLGQEISERLLTQGWKPAPLCPKWRSTIATFPNPNISLAMAFAGKGTPNQSNHRRIGSDCPSVEIGPTELGLCMTRSPNRRLSLLRVGLLWIRPWFPVIRRTFCQPFWT
jgi:hypothetical protein